jgi:hypothetical protein
MHQEKRPPVAPAGVEAIATIAMEEDTSKE